jgi:hypothetical protein
MMLGESTREGDASHQAMRPDADISL